MKPLPRYVILEGLPRCVIFPLRHRSTLLHLFVINTIKVIPYFISAQYITYWNHNNNNGYISLQCSKKKRNDLYLGSSKSIIKDKISIDKHAAIPIIRNGTSMTLNAVKINKQSISVTNTCAFDSILQIFLTGSNDFRIVEEKVMFI